MKHGHLLTIRNGVAQVPSTLAPIRRQLATIASAHRTIKRMERESASHLRRLLKRYVADSAQLVEIASFMNECGDFQARFFWQAAEAARRQ